MIKSIFDLEKRIDIQKECFRLNNYLTTHWFSNSYRNSYDFWKTVDNYLITWPYRGTATTHLEFLDDLGIDIQRLDIMNYTQCFYFLQFIDNFTFFIRKNHHSLFTEYQKKYDTINDNISCILELSNYQRVINRDKIYYSKRDEDVDSLLVQLESEHSIKDLLLSYNDFRIENDIVSKRIILKSLGDYLEPKRKQLHSLDGKLTDNIFYLLNKAEIRHSENQITFKSNKQTIELYDKLFKMIIHLIRTEDIKLLNNEVSTIKQNDSL